LIDLPQNKETRNKLTSSLL